MVVLNALDTTFFANDKLAAVMDVKTEDEFTVLARKSLVPVEPEIFISTPVVLFFIILLDDECLLAMVEEFDKYFKAATARERINILLQHILNLYFQMNHI